MFSPASFTYQQIELSAIEYSPVWNLHKWSKNLPPLLEESLEEFGIIHPLRLTVAAFSDKKFTLLAGRRRLQWAKERGIKKVPCALYPASNTKEETAKLLFTVIEEQKLAGALNMTEKARFIEIARDFALPQDMMEHLYRLLPLKKNPALLKKLALLMTEPSSLLTKIDNGQLSFQIYEELGRIKSEKERQAILLLFENLQLGGNKQRRILQMLKECAYRDKRGRDKAQSTTIDALLREEDIARIISSSHLNIPQKIQHLSTLLEKRLFPELTKAEEDFQKRVKELQLMENQRLYHSPFFEKDEVRLETCFASLTECEEKVRRERWLLRSSGER